jgi:peptide chain release factor 3
LAGDLIRHPNHRSLRISDTLTESEALRLTYIPSCEPEILRHYNDLERIFSRM